MNILFIAPLPPPLDGQSLAAETIYRKLTTFNNVKVVDMAKPRPKNLLGRLYRYVEVLGYLFQILFKKFNSDLIYLTVSESVAGNIKDLFIYLICFNKLKLTFIHMLGGAGMKSILDRKGLLFKLNRFFISKMKGVIVEGQIQAQTFSQMISMEKIHIVPNFAEEYLFVNDNEICSKFNNVEPLQILYLSNLLYGKGYIELADAYISLSEDDKNKVKIVFVGRFDSDNFQNEFLDKIDGYKNLSYYGKFVSGNDKRALYCESHIFCLPSYYPYEGQPISILEAYATGCFVISTNHSGIPEVFSDKVNGIAVEKKSSKSIKDAIEKCIVKKSELITTALRNRDIALKKYRTSIYTSTLLKILCITNNDATT